MYEWEDKKRAPDGFAYGSLRDRSRKQTLTQTCSTQEVTDHMPCNVLVVRWSNLKRTDVLYRPPAHHQPALRREKYIWFERNSATKGRERKLNSAICTYEKRPMYMHNKWFMQFCNKKVQNSLCTSLRVKACLFEPPTRACLTHLRASLLLTACIVVFGTVALYVGSDNSFKCTYLKPLPSQPFFSPTGSPNGGGG